MSDIRNYKNALRAMVEAQDRNPPAPTAAPLPKRADLLAATKASPKEFTETVRTVLSSGGASILPPGDACALLWHALKLIETAAPEHVAQEEDERTLFEAHCKRKKLSTEPATAIGLDHLYADQYTRDAWDAWQAARALSQPSEAAPPLPTVQELEKVAADHVGHPADFAADVLERWGGWQPGLLGQGGVLAAPSLPAAAPAPTGQRVVDLVDRIIAELAGRRGLMQDIDHDTQEEIGAALCDIVEKSGVFAHQPAQEQASTTSVTETKRAHLQERGYKVVGYVMQNDNNNRCTVARGKVNWQSQAAQQAASAASPVVRAQSEESARRIDTDVESAQWAEIFYRNEERFTVRDLGIVRAAWKEATKRAAIRAAQEGSEHG